MSIYFGVSLSNAGRCLVVPLDSRMSNKQTSQELCLCCRKWQLAGFLHAECLGVYSDCWWRAPGNKREGPYSGLLTPRPAILVLPQTVHSILLKTSFWIHLLVGKDPAFVEVRERCSGGHLFYIETFYFSAISPLPPLRIQSHFDFSRQVSCLLCCQICSHPRFLLCLPSYFVNLHSPSTFAFYKLLENSHPPPLHFVAVTFLVFVLLNFILFLMSSQWGLSKKR